MPDLRIVSRSRVALHYNFCTMQKMVRQSRRPSLHAYERKADRWLLLLEEKRRTPNNRDWPIGPGSTPLPSAAVQDGFEVERIRETTVGTFVGRLYQEGEQLWVVPTVFLALRVPARAII